MCEKAKPLHQLSQVASPTPKGEVECEEITLWLHSTPVRVGKQGSDWDPRSYEMQWQEMHNTCGHIIGLWPQIFSNTSSIAANDIPHGKREGLLSNNLDLRKCCMLCRWVSVSTSFHFCKSESTPSMKLRITPLSPWAC